MSAEIATVAIDVNYILALVVGFLGWVVAFQQKMWKKLCKMARVIKRSHPKESELEGL